VRSSCAIANAPLADQAEVWKACRPKKGHEVRWWEVSRALSRQRIPFSAARFDAATAEEFGVIWQEDLFVPAGEDGRYTTNVEAFLAAQQAHMAASLPENGTILTLTEHGQPTLPKGAERVWGNPGKGDTTGHYVDPRTGDIETVTYRLPPPKKAARAGKGAEAVPPAGEPADEGVVVKIRPDVTQRGLAMIGDYRTDALHQALGNDDIPNETLIGLLVLALAAQNVTVQSTEPYGLSIRQALRERVAPDGVLTADHAVTHGAAREMLKHVLSCRANMTDSGISSRIAGEALGASHLLPSMATDEFLSCLSRQALERSAAAEGVKVEVRVKDTRAAMVARFKDATWRFPGALFALTPEERISSATALHRSAGHSTVHDTADGEADENGSPLGDVSDEGETQLSEAAD
jgi:ParB family chromosome partitioning protein